MLEEVRCITLVAADVLVAITRLYSLLHGSKERFSPLLNLNCLLAFKRLVFDFASETLRRQRAVQVLLLIFQILLEFLQQGLILLDIFVVLTVYNELIGQPL